MEGGRPFRVSYDLLSIDFRFLLNLKELSLPRPAGDSTLFGFV